MTLDLMQEIIDALEYRLAKLEDQVWAHADLATRRAVQHRRHKYYALFTRSSATPETRDA